VVGSQQQCVVQELVRQFRSLDTGLRTIVEQAFPRRMILSCADSHASNLAAEKGGQRRGRRLAPCLMPVLHPSCGHSGKKVHGSCPWHCERFG
jgi:hypothetical protein